VLGLLEAVMTNYIGKLVVENAKVGVSVDTDADLVIGAAEFNNVEIPYQVTRVGKANISNTTIRNDPKIREPQVPKGALGWRRPARGAPLPSHCPKCDNVFASMNYQFSGGYFNLWNNQDTCIVCGYEEARLSEGHFRLTHQAIEILRSPEITRDMVRRLAELGDDVLHGRLHPDAAIAAASALHPTLGDFAGKLLGLGLGAYFLYASIAGTVSATWDVAEKFGLTNQEVVTQKVLEKTLEEFGRSWQERLKQPGGSIFDNEPEGAPMAQEPRAPADHKAFECAPSKVEKSKRRSERRAEDRRRFVDQRRAFGRSRSK
jgi:hypothetical protein